MSKVLVVTGGSRGIGAATARLAATRGYEVAISYRTQKDEAQRIVDSIRASGQRAIAVQADVRKTEDIENLFTAVDREFGRLDALVNSAGIGSWGGRIDETDPLALDDLFRTNVLGLIIATREAVRRLSTRRGGNGGVIVNVSSMAATIGGRPGVAHYAASKAAVDAFTTGLAKEVAPEGIRAVVVRPGFTETDMTSAAHTDPEIIRAVTATIPLGRIAKPEEIAHPIVWLLSHEASFISGAHLDVSGGGFLVGGRPLPSLITKASSSLSTHGI